MQHLNTTKLWDGLDRLACSTKGRWLIYAGIIVISLGACLAAVWPDARFIPGWQPATTKIVAGGTDILLHGKMLGFIKGNFSLPPTIWVLLTSKADYYEVHRPISGHGLLVTPLVITAVASVAVAVLLAVLLAWHRRRFGLPWRDPE